MRGLTTRIATLKATISALETIVEEARERSSYAAAVSGVGRLAGLRSELDRLRALSVARRLTDPLDELIALRRVAEADGSWVAASRYASTEADLRVRLAEVEARRESEAMRDLTEDEHLEIIVAAIHEIPLELLNQVSDAVLARLGMSQTPAE